MKSLLIILFFTATVTSYPQDQDRGCQAAEIFCVSSSYSNWCGMEIYDLPPITQNTLPFKASSYFQHIFSWSGCDDCDTFLIELKDTNDIIFSWDFFNDSFNSSPYSTLEEQTPFWYKNDTLLDDTNYLFQYAGTNYCGGVDASSIFKIHTPGYYELRKIGNVETRLPVFHLYYPKKDTLSVTNDTINPNISIYPNPSKSFVNINYNEITQGNVFIYDLTGRLVSSFSLDSTQTSTKIDISHISSGSYLLSVMSNKSIIYQTKLLKL